jgi:alpha,alpha-trehalose phosphorylase
VHPWQVCEPAFDLPAYKVNEAVFALSNGYLGQRASFEEGASGADSLRGTYVAGLFDAYPNPTMIKLKGRPSHPHEMVNIPDPLPLTVSLDGEAVDLTTAAVHAYTRTLDMQRGVLTRDVEVETPGGKRARLVFTRFLSRPRPHLAAMQVAVTPLNFAGEVAVVSAVNGDVRNASHPHLGDVATVTLPDAHGVVCRTLTTGVDIAVLATETISPLLPSGGEERPGEDEGLTSRRRFTLAAAQGDTVTVVKLVAVATSRDLDVVGDAVEAARAVLADGAVLGFDALLAEHAAAWATVWDGVGIEIDERDGSGALTQGLRYSLFQMIQNASTFDHTVNIGAKGLTGEHYYGTYFWDTEVFMLPMFAFITPDVARNLVRNRAYLLPGARRKAEEMALAGAAYPWMSDENGDESTILWQFGLMAVHVTADVAWGVWFYYCVTGDLDFIADGGIDILVETSRCWLSRVHYRADLGRYVINRVLGPDEYHQGVDNNYYTNIMAQENLLKTVRLLDTLRDARPEAYAAAVARLGLTDVETARFREVGDAIYLPYDAQLGINLQDDRFLTLEPHDLQADPLPGAIPAVWSYDRAMRTQLLRQGDVVVAHILLGDRFTDDQMRRDFAFYEPKTTHDSSLSFNSHSIVAAHLRDVDMAYDYFLRTARLDLDDIHGNSWMGIHTACLAGAWQCVVFGFGGVRWYDGALTLDPVLPPQWTSFSFSLVWHGTRLHVTVRADAVTLRADAPVALTLAGRALTVEGEVTVANEVV